MKYKTFDVYTPTTPASLTFVEREELTDQLVNAIWTPGKQIVVYGHSGSGKTTLLQNKLNQTRENWIKTSCTRDSTLDSLVRDAFDQLGPFYTKQILSTEKDNHNHGIALEYGGIKASLNSSSEQATSETQERVLPPQLTPSRLIDFLGVANALWVVEDFHKIGDDEKVRFAQMLKLFVDKASQYREVKVVCIGAVDTAREVIECDAEMQNRVSEIHVPLMSQGELQQIIEKGESFLNCKFEDFHKKEIIEYSSGLASVCHQLCLNTCLVRGLLLTQDDEFCFTDKDIEEALKRYVGDESDSLKSVYDKAVRRKRDSKYDNCRMIVNAMAILPKEGVEHSEILAKVREQEPEYPSGNLTTYLNELQKPDRGELIRYDASSGTYSFANPFYRTWAQIKMQLPKKMQKKLFATEPAFSDRILLIVEKVKALQQLVDD